MGLRCEPYRASTSCTESTREKADESPIWKSHCCHKNFCGSGHSSQKERATVAELRVGIWESTSERGTSRYGSEGNLGGRPIDSETIERGRIDPLSVLLQSASRAYQLHVEKAAGRGWNFEAWSRGVLRERAEGENTEKTKRRYRSGGQCQRYR